MSKTNVSFFVSYAHANNTAKDNFLTLFKEQAGPSKRFCYSFWQDTDIAVGDGWDDSIKQAIKNTDFGLLLVSPAFLNSNYIESVELRSYLNKSGKRCFPVMLAPVDFERHDLKGLSEKQIFRLVSSGFKSPRAFTELRSRRRSQFAYELFAQIDDWLSKNHGEGL